MALAALCCFRFRDFIFSSPLYLLTYYNLYLFCSTYNHIEVPVVKTLKLNNIRSLSVFFLIFYFFYYFQFSILFFDMLLLLLSLLLLLWSFFQLYESDFRRNHGGTDQALFSFDLTAGM